MLTIGTAVIRPASALVSSAFMKRTTAAIDEYSPPWIPPSRQRCGPSRSPAASKHGSSSPASSSWSKRIVRRSIIRPRARPRPRDVRGGLRRPREVAGGDVLGAAGAGREQRVLRRAERLLRDRAARVEAAAARQADRARRVADDRGGRRGAARNELRDRAEQALRVRVPRVREQLVGRRGLDDPAEVHDRHAVADVPDDGHVVRDRAAPSARASARSSSSRLSTVACTETSSAETGSSATSTSGSSASARAMLTRWRWPPENCRGCASSARGPRPTRSSELAAARVDLLLRDHVVRAQQLARASASRSSAG